MNKKIIKDFNTLDIDTQLIIYLRIAEEQNAIFATRDDELIKAAEKLISEGKAIEIDGP